jgi:hypothetical protein
MMAARTEWEGTATHLLVALTETAGVRAVKARRWPGCANVLSNRLRRSMPFLREVGIEIHKGRERRAGTRMIHITTVASESVSENAGVRPSASSASSASAPKHNRINGLPAPHVLTVRHDADDDRQTLDATVSISALKINAVGIADDADAISLAKSTDEETSPPRWRGRL